MHRYTFASADNPHIVLDLTANLYNYANKNVWTFVRVENDSSLPVPPNERLGPAPARLLLP